ncbi:hypothetical protein MKW98_000190 [Papaver atlanticum]|uniref:Uncharacterized protein n=1 Tax=Papaver atlanticum TaxID=357466 RepID=A0AAD4XJP7_9MAGN|nr:hypothetical protein MKW98_000190 [Papaver atlanticum]
MQDEKKMKVKKGCVAVHVGLEGEDGGFQRFVIPISCLYHPLFKRLLDKTYEVYGYHSNGPLTLPCSVDDFLHLRWRIQRETSSSSHHHQHNNSNHQCHRSSSFPFSSC